MENDSCGAYLYNYGTEEQDVDVVIWADGQKLTTPVTVGKEACVSVRAVGGEIISETVETGEKEPDEYLDITSQYLSNPGFEEDETWGTKSAVNLNGILYDPCYVNTVAATNNKWPQILPTKGWSPANALKGGSNFALLYSMPYSTDIYCVSPSNVGNSASIMAAPASDEIGGTRCLSILNS